MDIAILILAGAIAGWIGFAYFGFNEDRGLIVSLIIGGVGGYIGGKVLGPMVGAVGAVPGEFSPAALFLAIGIAGALLYAANFVQERFGV